MAMQYTEMGRKALLSGLQTLSTRERQIMRLACGAESSQKILESLGQEATVIVHKLVLMGMIAPAHHTTAPSSYTTQFARTRIGDSRFADSMHDGFMHAPDALPPDQPDFASQAVNAAKSASNPLDEQAFNDSVFGDVSPLPKDAHTRGAEAPAAMPPVLDDTPRTLSPTAPASVAATSALPAPSPAPGRSLDMSRMYVCSMLQMLQSANARELAQNLQQSSDDQLLEHLLQAVEYYSQAVGAQRANRLRARLRELLPQEHVSLLRIWDWQS